MTGRSYTTGRVMPVHGRRVALARGQVDARAGPRRHDGRASDPAAIADRAEHEVGQIRPRDRQPLEVTAVGAVARGERTVGQARRPHDGPVEAALPEQLQLATLL